MKKEFIRAIFGGPSTAREDYPTRLKEEIFAGIADAGINRVFGVVAGDEEETLTKSFEYCEKYNMKFYPTPTRVNDYVRVVTGKNGEKAFKDLTPEELAELDADFLTEIEGFSKNPSFGGIFFCDEKGYLAAEGIAHAKNIYNEKFGNYEFHSNFVSYAINDDIFWGGMGGVKPEELPFKLEGDLATTHENRFNFYDILITHLCEGAKREFMSQDMYPFERFCTVPRVTHKALFELNGYFNQKKRDYGSKFYNYMQLGQWVEGYQQMNFAEMALQMHVTAAYGSEGFAFFPGVFPLDFLYLPQTKASKDGKCGLYDIYGKKTIFCGWTKKLNEFFKQFEDDILSSELLGVDSYGTYKNGFTEDEIKDLLYNECIFRGDLPDMLRYDSNLTVESDNEVMVSTFERDGKKRYYLINLSTVYDNKVTVELPEGQYTVYGLDEVKETDHRITLEMGAGQGCYILEK